MLALSLLSQRTASAAAHDALIMHVHDRPRHHVSLGVKDHIPWRAGGGGRLCVPGGAAGAAAGGPAADRPQPRLLRHAVHPVPGTGGGTPLLHTIEGRSMHTFEPRSCDMLRLVAVAAGTRCCQFVDLSVSACCDTPLVQHIPTPAAVKRMNLQWYQLRPTSTRTSANQKCQLLMTNAADAPAGPGVLLHQGGRRSQVARPAGPHRPPGGHPTAKCP